MKRRAKEVVLLLMTLFMSVAVYGETYSGRGRSQNYFDWEPVMKAIIQVESEGNARAKRGSSVGAMQITPILVAECNQILRARKSKKRYRLSDRFSVAKSKEMFLLFQSKYNPLNSIEKAIRSWNGGLNYSVKQTQRYYEKVMKALR